ncbi:siroheme synthase [Candidatus Colwellia aromaticivorans]|uniref:siroheme synthase n=1 Tax=Candidatus Colwellia aromaticivorans TaxID=2267621 RepID=UPI000DF2F0C1|nr:NAD(P)-dependent oxidoreductase [Candidatus Colwellia aromaticivorans]
MKYFPIFLDANYIAAMVIGGGEVASRKIELLLKTTVNIIIMSKDVCASVERLINLHKLTWLKHNYQTGHFSHINLVIAATDETMVNKAIAEEASTLNILTNVVDQPELCTYITPAIIDRSPMIIALSSSGSAPILIRMLREQIEKTLPQGYGKLADFSYKFREHVKARVKGIRNRRSFWENTLRGPIGQAVLDGKQQQAEQQLIASIKQEIAPPSGEIIFIHTQDGNPDNLTLNAHRAMQFVDAVFYDNKVNVELIEYVRRDAEKFPQPISSEILLNYQHAIELAEQGQRVLYLLAGNGALPQNEALAASNITTQELVSGS